MCEKQQDHHIRSARSGRAHNATECYVIESHNNGDCLAYWIWGFFWIIFVLALSSSSSSSPSSSFAIDNNVSIIWHCRKRRIPRKSSPANKRTNKIECEAIDELMPLHIIAYYLREKYEGLLVLWYQLMIKQNIIEFVGYIYGVAHKT